MINQKNFLVSIELLIHFLSLAKVDVVRSPLLGQHSLPSAFVSFVLCQFTAASFREELPSDKWEPHHFLTSWAFLIPPESWFYPLTPPQPFLYNNWFQTYQLLPCFNFPYLSLHTGVQDLTLLNLSSLLSLYSLKSHSSGFPPPCSYH